MSEVGVSCYSFVEGTVIGPWGARHLVVMVKLDNASASGWSWVTGPCVLPGESFEYRENDVADWAETMRRHGITP